MNLRHALGTSYNRLHLATPLTAAHSILLLGRLAPLVIVFPFFSFLLLTFAAILDAFTEVTLHSFPVSWMSRSYVGSMENCGCWFSSPTQFPNCLASGGKPGVAEFCSVTVEMNSYLWSYGPSSGWAGSSLCYSHVHHFKTAL
jgi:hypothetical protein